MNERTELLYEQATALKDSLASMGFKLSPHQAQEALCAVYDAPVFRNTALVVEKPVDPQSSGRITLLIEEPGSDLFEMALGRAFRASKNGANIHAFDPASLAKEKKGAALKRLHFWVSGAKDTAGELLIVEDARSADHMAKSLHLIETLVLDRGWDLSFLTTEAWAQDIVDRHPDRPVRTLFLSEEEGYIPLEPDPPEGT